MTDAADVTVTIVKRDSLDGTVTQAEYTNRTSGGIHRMRQSANLVQVGLSGAGGDYRFVQGYEIDAVAGGRA